MANTNAPFGLMQLGLSGSPVANFALTTLKNGISSANGTAIYTGDLIKMLSTGFLAQWTAGTAVSQAWGVFAGCKYSSTSQQTTRPSPYWPGSDAASGTVEAYFTPGVLSPAPLFLIQTDATGITSADIGANADVNVGTGSTITGKSGSFLDTATLAVTATLPLRIVDLWSNRVGASIGPGTQTGAYNWAVVALNITGSTGI
jgi:hypothetical protein